MTWRAAEPSLASVASLGGAAADGTGPRRPALVWRFEARTRVAATAVLGGGIAERRWVVNAQVATDYARTDPAEHASSIAAALGLDGPGAGLLTAAPVEAFTTGEADGVRCDATVGLSVPTWAAAPAAAEQRPVAGTVNLVCQVPAPLSDAALLNAVVTATEAKVQALVELAVPGTGTATDAVVVCCPPGGSEPYAGPRSTWGGPLARAVHAAVRDGAREHLARQA